MDISLTNATAAGAPANDTSFDETIYAYVRPEDSAAVPVELIPADLVKHLALSGNAYAQVSLQFIGQSNSNTIKSNTMKFTVGVMLTTFGVFWGAEGAGASWPGEDAAILGVLAFVVLLSLAMVALLRHRRAEVVAV